MNARYLLILVPVLHAGLAVAENSESGPLTVTAQIPVVRVLRHPPGRHFLSLPTLEYTFEVGMQCGDNATPQSLSVNVADSRTTLFTDELDGSGQQEVVLKVPARQIAPIAVDNFCVMDVDDAISDDAISIVEPDVVPMGLVADPDQTTVGAALSAQVSLLCRGDSEQKITYVTRPLDVTLTCETPPPVGTGPKQQAVTGH